MTQKRFPATVSLELTTFLNDKKVDAELYALFQQYSKPDAQKRTVVQKKDLPKQSEICSLLAIKSPKTYRAHRDYLITRGFIIEEEDFYILPDKEDIFLMIPLKTLQFLEDSLSDRVIKVYIYLGQRWKYKQNNYYFTLKEIGQHIGVSVENNTRGYEMVNNVLMCLKKLSLLDFEDCIDTSQAVPIPKKRLIDFNLQIDQLNG